MNYTIISVESDQRELNIENIKEALGSSYHAVKAFKASDQNDWNGFKSLYPKFEVDQYQLTTRFLSYPHRRIGEIGCWMSHFNAWNYIIDNDIDHLLIVEDDCLINSDIVEEIEDIAKRYELGIFGEWGELMYITKDVARYLINNYFQAYTEMPVDRYVIDVHEKNIFKSVKIQIVRQATELYGSKIDFSTT
jgi:hypothetical protein